MSMKNSNDTVGNRTRDLSVCSAVPQPLRHRVPPCLIVESEISPRDTEEIMEILHTGQNFKYTIHVDKNGCIVPGRNYDNEEVTWFLL
jgi:hypothetical protein